MIARRGRAALPDGRLLGQAPGATRWLALAIGCDAAAVILVVIGAYLLGSIVAGVFVGGQTLAEAGPALVAVAVLGLARVPLIWAGAVLAQVAAGSVTGAMRAGLTGHLLALGPAFTGRERSGELASLVVGGLDTLDTFVTGFLPAQAMAVVGPLIVLVAVASVDPPTVLVLLFTGPILVLILAVIGGRTRSVTERRFAEVRFLSAVFLDMLQGIATLKAFGRSAEQVETIRAMSRRYGDTTMEVLRTAFQTSLVLEWGAAVAVALVAVEVSLRLMGGSIGLERGLAVLIIVPEFFLPLRALAIRYHTGAAGRAVAIRAFAVLDEPVPAAPVGPPETGGPAAPGGPPAPGGAPAAVASRDPVRGRDIVFDGVGVTYPGRQEPALRDLDLVVPAHRVLALVGETGAGKTTVANLLLRFIEPDAGTIRVGGTDLAAIDPSTWRSSVAWVAQRPYLFHGSVADNIRLARPDATDAEVLRAASDAGATGFIAGLPAGLDTPVGEGGARLSGGQRQRVAIARAFLADAPLVILDEVTAHLDAASEVAVRDAIGRLSAGRTVVIVSHRLRLAAMADTIVVLAGGRAVETGPPTVLAARDGPYARLLAAAPGDAPGFA